MTINQYSIMREDHLFDYGDSFSSKFLFSPRLDEKCQLHDGIVETHEEGYDFVNECSPVLQMGSITDELLKDVGLSLNEMELKVSIKDPGLHSRELVVAYPLNEVKDGVSINIKLKDYPQMAFYSGFTVGVTIGVLKTQAVSGDNPLWHRSRNIFSKEFVCRTSASQSAFKVNYGIIPEDMSQATLYYINWKSVNVSELPPSELFDVIINHELTEKHILLETQTKWGHFAANVILSDVFSEIIQVCLMTANIDVESEPGSLHSITDQFLNDRGYSFLEMAKALNNDLDPKKPIDQLRHIKGLAQEFFDVYGGLKNLKFGGQIQLEGKSV